jgi:uncharacterized protein (DUF58 family)
MNVRIAALILAATLTGATGVGVLAAEEIVELRVRGRFYAEPATVRVTVAVAPDARNRSLVIQADGERLFRSSELELSGENGKRLHTFEFKNLPAGYYIIRAEVRSSSNVRAAAEQELVVGDPGEL